MMVAVARCHLRVRPGRPNKQVALATQRPAAAVAQGHEGPKGVEQA